MVDELITIKKLYGEKMMHLCRDSFSTILETPGLLLGLLKKKFDPSHELYYDLEKNGLIDNFKKFIYFSLGKETSRIVTDKSIKKVVKSAPTTAKVQQPKQTSSKQNSVKKSK